MRALLAAGGVALAFAATSPAAAQTMVMIGGSARACYEAAMAEASDLASERLCTLALETQPLDEHDRAGTYGNRGAIKFYRGDFDAAQQDFEEAIRIAPQIGEVYISRGAALQRMGLYSEAIAEIDRGLALSPQNPARGYYNRAVVRQNMNDLTGAYLDYRRAAELAPDWAEPRLMMEQFVVEPAPKGQTVGQ